MEYFYTDQVDYTIVFLKTMFDFSKLSINLASPIVFSTIRFESPIKSWVEISQEHTVSAQNDAS